MTVGGCGWGRPGFCGVRLGPVQEVAEQAQGGMSVHWVFSAGFAALAEPRWRRRLRGPRQGQGVQQLRSCARGTLLGRGSREPG